MGALITGWGKCIPPAVLTNDAMAKFVDTDNEWIVTRTGIRERRISHVGMVQLAAVASERALAAAGLSADAIDCIIVATASADMLVPNAASRVQLELGNLEAAALDTNTGCCGFVYALAMANGFLATGVHERILVIGAERLTTILDWTLRDSAILFGDGAGAVVVESGPDDSGVQGSFLACNPVAGESLMVRDLGMKYAHERETQPYQASFDGREVFRNAVPGMVRASHMAMQRAGVDAADIDLLVPHQANLRIIEAVGKKLPISDDKVMTNLQRYGNTSAASIPLALTEAVEQGRVEPGGLLLFAAFGAGLTSAASVIRWGERVAPLASSDAQLAACESSALDLLTPALEFQRQWHTENGAE